MCGIRPQSGVVVEVERAEMEVGEEPAMGGGFGEAWLGDMDQEVVALRDRGPQAGV
jgi:hypothetical protein